MSKNQNSPKYSLDFKKKEMVIRVKFSILFELLMTPVKDEFLQKVTALHLTQRQDQIRQMIKQGKAYGEIASALNISVSTVKFHASTIRAKLGAKWNERIYDLLLKQGL